MSNEKQKRSGKVEQLKEDKSFPPHDEGAPRLCFFVFVFSLLHVCSVFFLSQAQAWYVFFFPDEKRTEEVDEIK